MFIRYRLRAARAALARKAWGDAFATFSAGESEGGLDAEDLERLAMAADLSGRPEESADAWTKAHQQWLRLAEPLRGVRCAFWLGMGLMNRGEQARAGGWFGRAHELLAGQPDSAEAGLLMLPTALQELFQGNAAAALKAFEAAGAAAQRFGDPDLLALSRLGRGRATVELGNLAEGVALLDEAMRAVTSGEASPIVVGIVYCAVIDVCQQIFDLRRAGEWTMALNRWCTSQIDLVPFRGECSLHRAEMMLLRGEWPEAMGEARQAAVRLSDPPGQEGAGSAFYQQAELHRLRGEFAEAEELYRVASRWGRQPEPGLAQLRLAQGQPEAAARSIRFAVEAAEGRLARTRLLPPYVEIMLATADVVAARAGAEELAATAATLTASSLDAVAAMAMGAVLRAEGDFRGALAALRRASDLWRQLDAPFEGARARVLIGLSCLALGDRDSADLEFDAARWAFGQLGAAPDLTALEALLASGGEAGASGLTPRELEVLRLIATGKTNRAIAADLVISEKTVARHISNIFTKLGLPSRAAATAYAYEHGLV
jgi:DNA-binding CsgD family transcriptional regulator